MEENISFKKERSNIKITNKSQVVLEGDNFKVNKRILKNLDQQEHIENIALYDVMRMSEFLNVHVKNITQESDKKEIRFGNEVKDYNYLELVEDLNREKILDNPKFFYNGKEFANIKPQKAKKGIKFNNIFLAENNTAVNRINPITKCVINFSDDENSDINHNSDIDLYFEE